MADLCDRCNRDDAQDEHECPYQVEMAWSFERDDLPLCNCCSDCTSRCAADV